MARRRKSARRRTTRRSIGALTFKGTQQKQLIFLGAIAAGYLMSDKINEMVQGVTGSLDPKIVALIELAVGFAIPQTVLKNMAGRIVGGVLIGAGLKKGLKSFGVIKGIGQGSAYPWPLKTIQGHVAGMGYTLPESSAYPQSMSVVNGLGCADQLETGEGCAAAY